MFPNTIPPFFAWGPLGNWPAPASRRDLERRWAGIHAHNRWLAEFCGTLPGRRAGVAQLMLDDVERAVEEVNWVSEQPGLFGGVLVPNPNPDSGLDQLHSPVYEPLWTACERLGVVVNTHGGGGLPDLGAHPATPMMLFLEYGWYSHRPLVRLIYGGVLERHPQLTFVLTETGNSWVPGLLGELDWFYAKVVNARHGSVEERFGGSVRDELAHKPSEYWRRQCYLGASFLSARDCAQRVGTGVDRIMWGADYPHSEGTHPHTALALRQTFAGVDHREVAQMLGENAARAYGFDLDALGKVAAQVGPRVEDVDRPVSPEEVPADALSMALTKRPTPA